MIRTRSRDTHNFHTPDSRMFLSTCQASVVLYSHHVTCQSRSAESSPVPRCLTTVETHSSLSNSKPPQFAPSSPDQTLLAFFQLRKNSDVFLDRLGKFLKGGYSLSPCLFLNTQIPSFFFFWLSHCQVYLGVDSKNRNGWRGFPSGWELRHSMAFCTQRVYTYVCVFAYVCTCLRLKC